MSKSSNKKLMSQDQKLYLGEWIEKKSKDGYIYFYNIKTGKSQWAIPTEKVTYEDREMESRQFNIQSNLEKHIKNKNLDKIKIRGLSWTGNSCYLDSILVAFFVFPNKFTDQILYMDLSNDENYIKPSSNDIQPYPCGDNFKSDIEQRIKIQEELKKIVSYIRNLDEIPDKKIKTCSDLRRLFINCKNVENYHDDNIKDSGEFISYLLSFFNTFSLPSARNRHSKYVTNTLGIIENCDDLVKRSIYVDYSASIIRFIPYDTLNIQTREPRKISDFFIILEDTYPETLIQFTINGVNYKRLIDINILESAPYIIFNLERYKGGDVLKTKIIPEDVIKIPNTDEKFMLVSIVLYDSHHYSCLFYHDGAWYYYNDVARNKIRKIGIYSDIFNFSLDPTTNGVQYFYAKL